MTYSRTSIYTLSLIVAIAGMSQGMTLPLLSILLEDQNVSPWLNGLNASALYIGVLLVSPWIERPMQKYGYRTTIFFGLAAITVTTLLLPFWQGLTVWFLLRLLLGMGDSALHYASQLWVASISPEDRRGRDISLYGFSYGAGFSVGPLFIPLKDFGTWVPFVAMTAFYLIAFVLLLRLPNHFPEQQVRGDRQENRYMTVIRLSWLALLPSFLFGFMESSLNGNFPVYALRLGLTADAVSLLLPSFVVGSLLLQMPLGTLSDKWGRKRVLLTCTATGAICFFALPLAGDNVWLLMAILGVCGAMVGSVYSLGLAYAADLLPKHMIPAAGIIAGVLFSIASIAAPNVNGFLLGGERPWLMFAVLGGMMALYTLFGWFFGSKRPVESAVENNG